MGGHGGLNILPQKRWNVYRRDNRAKVARDEAEYRRREGSEERKRRVGELDRKIGKLRRRGPDESGDGRSSDASRSRSPVSNRGRSHINLFSEEEKAFQQVEQSHSKYLTEIGHDPKVSAPQFYDSHASVMCSLSQTLKGSAVQMSRGISVQSLRCHRRRPRRRLLRRRNVR